MQFELQAFHIDASPLNAGGHYYPVVRRDRGIGGVI